jgi:hypothetical protein
MNILLIGEFSGVHNNLKKGLKELGHDVRLAADGDGYRNFDSDFKISPYKGKYLGKVLNILYFTFNFRKFIGYDVIQFINPFVLPYYYNYIGITKFLLLFNKKKIYYACGTDPAFINSKDKFEYFPFDKVDSPEFPKFNNNIKSQYNRFIFKMDKIIPSMYTYYVGYKDNLKLTNPILLPSTGATKNLINPVGSKIKILFGITRRDFKGADFIIDALDLIKKRYFEIVEIEIVEKISYNEYINLLSTSDILIDQCKSYDYGMNAILAMEKGLIVFSGAEPIAMDFLGLKDCPVINILPNTEHIIKRIEEIIKTDSININLRKAESRRWIQSHHNFFSVAKSFCSIYDENII